MTAVLQINKGDLRQARFVDDSIPAKLIKNEVLLAVDQVALTANNITYAVTGDYLRYWDFFPASEAGWGRLPVWGFADVAASAHPDVVVGERVYGYFPLATHLVVQADRVHPSGFRDAAPHRQNLNAVYNHYIRTGAVPGFDQEQLNALLRPMFTTSYLLDDFLWDNDLFTAEMLVLSSASSKTGYGTAFLLKENRPVRRRYEIVGLTSLRNRAYVESLGCYDRVLSYEEVRSLPQSEPAIYVDFSGSGPLRHAVHTHFGDNLHYDSAIGLTDWERRGSAGALPGVKPELFFAPAQAQKRSREWGSGHFQARLGEALAQFMAFAAGEIDIVECEEPDAMLAAYLAFVEGTASPRSGYMLLLSSMWGAAFEGMSY